MTGAMLTEDACHLLLAGRTRTITRRQEASGGFPWSRTVRRICTYVFAASGGI
jgi:hypothetical protein